MPGCIAHCITLGWMLRGDGTEEPLLCRVTGQLLQHCVPTVAPLMMLGNHPRAHGEGYTWLFYCCAVVNCFYSSEEFRDRVSVSPATY